MKLEVKGRVYENFLEATAEVRLDVLSNSFSISAGVNNTKGLPFKVGDECVVTVDGERILTGHIEILSGGGDSTSRIVHLVGRDRTGDIVDSGLGSISDITPNITMKRLVEIIIDHLGADIDVVDFTDARFTEEDGAIAPEAGDNAFDFLEKLARKKSVILTSNSEGNVVIQRASGEESSNQVLNVINGGERNNVVNYDFEYDMTQRFQRYEVIGNSNINALIARLFNKEVVDKRGFVTDQQIREGRQFILNSENSGDASLMQERSEWERNIRQARSKTYRATLHGYRGQSGALWTAGTIVKVVDDYADINDYMLINTVIYRFDSRGRSTELKLIARNAYSLLAEEPIDKDEDGNGAIAAAIQSRVAERNKD